MQQLPVSAKRRLSTSRWVCCLPTLMRLFNVMLELYNQRSGRVCTESGTPLLSKSAFHRSKYRLTTADSQLSLQVPTYQGSMCSLTVPGAETNIPLRRTSSSSRLDKVTSQKVIPKARCSSAVNLSRQNAFDQVGLAITNNSSQTRKRIFINLYQCGAMRRAIGDMDFTTIRESFFFHFL